MIHAASVKASFNLDEPSVYCAYVPPVELRNSARSRSAKKRPIQGAGWL